MQTFYIARNGEHAGPFTENELRAKIQAGEISSNDHAWTDGLSEWVVLSELLPDISGISTRSSFVPKALPNGFSPKKRWLNKIMGPLGELQAYEDKVTITTTGVAGVLARGLKGTKTIPFHSITAIEFKRAGITRGYIQFTVPGGNENQGDVFDAAGDENTFVFDEESSAEVEMVKNYIESRIREIRALQPTNLSTQSLGDELSKLAALKSKVC